MLKKMMTKFLDWLVNSSANPEEYSATVQGIILHAFGIILPVLTLLHLPISVDNVTTLISQSCQVLGIALAAAGLVRKGYYAIKALFVTAKTVVQPSASTVAPIDPALPVV